jgi:hypothetical protein
MIRLSFRTYLCMTGVSAAAVMMSYSEMFLSPGSRGETAGAELRERFQNPPKEYRLVQYQLNEKTLENIRSTASARSWPFSIRSFIRAGRSA